MLVDYETDSFSAQEQAALRYAEQVTRDEKQVSAEYYTQLRQYLSEGEIVEIGVLIAVCNGFDKLIDTWKLSPEVCELRIEPD